MSISLARYGFALSLLLAAMPAAWPADPDLAAAVDACVGAAMADRGVPGAAVAVVLDGGIAYEQGYGVKHAAQGGSVGPTTLFRTGSVQKMMTAAAVMAQVDRGLLSLDESITALVPELRMAGPWPAGAMTIEQLLTHTAGFPDLSALACAEDLSQWVPSLADASTLAPAGLFYNYSNGGYSMAGLAAERAAGIPYPVLMREAIWDPAGMQATFATPAEALLYADYAFGHGLDDAGMPQVLGPDAYECPWSNPSGDAFTTAGDLARFAMQMFDGGAILSPESAAAMQTPRTSIPPFDGLSYGYGIMIHDAEGVRVLEHDGVVPGWGSHLMWIPEAAFAVAVVDNAGASLADASRCVAGAVLGLDTTIGVLPARPRQEWHRYRGLYSVVSADGEAFPVLVDRGDDALAVTLPDPATGQMVTLPALPVARDTFFLDLDANGVPSALEFVTFVQPAGVRGRMWFVNRAYVGSRFALPIPREKIRAAIAVSHQAVPSHAVSRALAARAVLGR